MMKKKSKPRTTSLSGKATTKSVPHAHSAQHHPRPIWHSGSEFILVLYVLLVVILMSTW